MENMIDFVNNHVGFISCDESLASMLREKIKDVQKKPFIGDYYNLKDLCNLAQTYWIRTNPKVEESLDLQRVYEWGNKLHKDTQKWLETFPDFVTSEGVLDGAWVDIPGVRGRIDSVIGDSIFEIKTKLNIPQTKEEVLSNYPQDVEQISFYSVLHPSHYSTNYILFVKDAHPFELKAFRVEIKDLGKLKSLMKSRMKLLDECIKNKDPIPLGRCRYYGQSCQFGTDKICHCEKLVIPSTNQLEESIDISFDKEMTNKLEDIRKKFNLSKKFFSTLDIISPRRYNLKKDWIPDKSKEGNKELLGALVKKLPIGLAPDERRTLFNSIKEPRLHVAYKWAKLKSSGNQDSLIVPYTVKVNTTRSIQTRPHEYFLAELGIISANYGKPDGIIFIIYPNKDNFVQAFKVTYKKIDEILNKIKEIVIKLDKNEKDIFQFPPCPNFMNDKGKCSLMKDCNSREGLGCVK